MKINFSIHTRSISFYFLRPLWPCSKCAMSWKGQRPTFAGTRFAAFMRKVTFLQNTYSLMMILLIVIQPDLIAKIYCKPDLLRKIYNYVLDVCWFKVVWISLGTFLLITIHIGKLNNKSSASLPLRKLILRLSSES